MSSRSVTAAALAVAGLLLVSGCSAPSVTDGRERGAPEFDPFRSSRVEFVPANTDALTTVKVAPARVIVDSLGIDMPIDVKGIDPDGQMSLPESPFRAGWYEYASAPNSPSGSTVIAAHVDSREEGVGPFARLRTVEVGTSVSVVDASGVTHTYVVTSLEKLDKDEVPWQRYFATFGEKQLVLITCGGDFVEEIRNYTDNYIVTAEKVS